MHKPASLTAFLIAASALLLLAGRQDRLSREEIEYYDLHLSFAATVVLNDGTRIELADFHVGSGRHRHWLLTGSSSQLYLPLHTIARIVRFQGSADRVTIFFNTGGQMSTAWAKAGTKKLHGTLPGGEAWEAAVESVREVKIRLIEPQDQGDSAGGGERPE